MQGGEQSLYIPVRCMPNGPCTAWTYPALDVVRVDGPAVLQPTARCGIEEPVIDAAILAVADDLANVLEDIRDDRGGRKLYKTSRYNARQRKAAAAPGHHALSREHRGRAANLERLGGALLGNRDAQRNRLRRRARHLCVASARNVNRCVRRPAGFSRLARSRKYTEETARRAHVLRSDPQREMYVKRLAAE